MYIFMFVSLISFITILSFVFFKKVISYLQLILSKLDEIHHCYVNKEVSNNRYVSNNKNVVNSINNARKSMKENK